MDSKVYFVNPPSECNCCRGGFREVMFDARIPGLGWACMCTKCFIFAGCKLGTGHGQKYHRQGDRRWLKVKG